MEEQIEEKLNEIYNFGISVKFKDFRQYNIYCRIDNEKAFEIPILLDARGTFESNIYNICLKIDKEIINLYKKKVI